MTLAVLPPEAYLWFKTLHIVGVVVWFAGLFYLVRLFIYHREAEELEPALRTAFQAQYGLMEKRLANIITTPGIDRKSTRLNSSHVSESRMPSSA